MAEFKIDQFLDNYTQAQNTNAMNDVITPEGMSQDDQVVAQDTGFTESVGEGLLNSTGLTQGADALASIWKTDEENKARQAQRQSENENRDMAGEMVGYAAGALPFMAGAGKIGVGLAATGAARISGSVAKRQAGKTFFQKSFASPTANYLAAEAGMGAGGMAYDYGLHQMENATYDRDEEFDVAQSALMNFGLGGVMAAGGLGLGAGAAATKKGFAAAKIRETVDSSGGYGKVRPEVSSQLSSKPSYKLDGNQWNMTTKDGKTIGGYVVDGNHFVDTKTSTLLNDDNMASFLSPKMEAGDKAKINAFVKMKKDPKAAKKMTYQEVLDTPDEVLTPKGLELKKGLNAMELADPGVMDLKTQAPIGESQVLKPGGRDIVDATRTEELTSVNKETGIEEIKRDKKDTRGSSSKKEDVIADADDIEVKQAPSETTAKDVSDAIEDNKIVGGDNRASYDAKAEESGSSKVDEILAKSSDAQVKNKNPKAIIDKIDLGFIDDVEAQKLIKNKMKEELGAKSGVSRVSGKGVQQKDLADVIESNTKFMRNMTEEELKNLKAKDIEPRLSDLDKSSMQSKQREDTSNITQSETGNVEYTLRDKSKAGDKTPVRISEAEYQALDEGSAKQYKALTKRDTYVDPGEDVLDWGEALKEGGIKNKTVTKVEENLDDILSGKTDEFNTNVVQEDAEGFRDVKTFDRGLMNQLRRSQDLDPISEADWKQFIKSPKSRPEINNMIREALKIKTKKSVDFKTKEQSSGTTRADEISEAKSIREILSDPKEAKDLVARIAKRIANKHNRVKNDSVVEYNAKLNKLLGAQNSEQLIKKYKLDSQDKSLPLRRKKAEQEAMDMDKAGLKSKAEAKLKGLESDLVAQKEILADVQRLENSIVDGSDGLSKPADMTDDRFAEVENMSIKDQQKVVRDLKERVSKGKSFIGNLDKDVQTELDFLRADDVSVDKIINQEVASSIGKGPKDGVTSTVSNFIRDQLVGSGSKNNLRFDSKKTFEKGKKPGYENVNRSADDMSSQIETAVANAAKRADTFETKDAIQRAKDADTKKKAKAAKEEAKPGKMDKKLADEKAAEVVDYENKNYQSVRDPNEVFAAYENSPVQLEVEGTNPKNTTEIDNYTASEVVFDTTDLPADAVSVDGVIFAKANADKTYKTLRVMTHEVIHDAIRKLGLSDTEIGALLKDNGIKFKAGDDLNEILTTNFTDNVYSKILGQNSKMLKDAGFTGEVPKLNVKGFKGLENLTDETIGIFNNPASGVNKWMSDFKDIKAPALPDNVVTMLSRSVDGKLGVFEKMDSMLDTSGASSWLLTDANAAKIQAASGAVRSLQNTIYDNMSANKDSAKKAIDAISPGADQAFGAGIQNGALFSARSFFENGKFNKKAYQQHIASTADDSILANTQKQITELLGLKPEDVKLGKGKGKVPARYDKDKKAYMNPFEQDINRLVNEEYGNVNKTGKVNTAENSYSIVSKYAKALRETYGSDVVFNDKVLRNLSRNVDEVVAIRRARNAMKDGGLDDTMKMFEHENAEGMIKSYMGQVEAGRGRTQSTLGFNPLDSNIADGYNMKLVAAADASKYIQTGDTAAGGKLELVYAPADEAVLGSQAGMLDDTKHDFDNNNYFYADRGTKSGTVRVNGADYNLKEFGMKPVGKANGKYKFKMSDSAKLRSENVHSNYSDIFSRNEMASYKENLSDNMNLRIITTLKQQGLVKTASQIGNEKGWIPYIENKFNGEQLFMQKKNEPQILGTNGIKITNAYVAPMVKLGKGIISAAKAGLITANPASYLNSYVANTVALNIHGGYMNPMQAQKDTLAAMTDIKKMRQKVNFYYKRLANPKTRDRAVQGLKDLQGDPLFYAMNDGGLQQSIRGASSNVGSMPSNEAATVLRNSGITKVSDSAMETFNFLAVDPKNKFWNTMGEKFDMTEVAPKIALQKRLISKYGMSNQEAASYVKMAFPDYNTNLPQTAALVDEVVPFMKFFASTPRMITFSAQQHPWMLLSTMALGKGIVMGSNAGWGTPYGEENGYFPIPFTDQGKYTGSMSNYTFSSPSAIDSSFMENGLGWFTPDSVNPLTNIVGN